MCLCGHECVSISVHVGMMNHLAVVAYLHSFVRIKLPSICVMISLHLSGRPLTFACDLVSPSSLTSLFFLFSYFMSACFFLCRCFDRQGYCSRG